MPGDANRSGMDLTALQRWMLDAVVAPHRLDDAGKAAAAAAYVRVADTILPSATLTAAERVGIYRNMYFLRLRDIMKGDFAAVHAVMGADAFDEMARGYLTRHPSRSYTLNSLGYALPTYLSTTHQPRDPLLVDLARLEATMEMSRHVPETPRLAPEALAAIAPERWPAVRFTPSLGFRVMAFDHDVYGILSAALAGEPLPALTPAETYVVLWRRDHELWRRRLSPTKYAILHALSGGGSLEAAMEAGAARWQAESEGDGDVLEQRIFEWFAEWIAEGFFRAVVTPP